MLKRSALALLAILLCTISQAATTVTVLPDKDTGVYDAGQTVTWTAQVLADKKPCSGKVTWRIKHGGADEIGKGEAALAEGKAQITGTRPDAGALLVEVKYKGEDGKEVTGLGGAVFSPDQIKVSAPRPDDFDKFWADKIAALNAIPMNVQITPGESGKPGVEYFKITMDNINGSKIHGQIAKPAGGTNLPAMLQVQWAGVYKLDKTWVTGHAAEGWLAMNISAHDLPIDEAPEFYKKQADTALNDYPGIGNDNRETAYFLRMFLSCYRAAEYLTKERPEWNKKTLLVHGGSQGGYQTLMLAGLHPAVTAFAASVPAGCDHTGKDAQRAPGWPNWASRTWQKKDYAKMIEASKYFDAVNFAYNIKCPGIVGVGLIDVTCPPEGVLAACNQMKGPKKVILMPPAGHMGPHGPYYAVFGPFLEEQRKK
ncbi:MAG TPA: acetylxylan esterase [Planctomycetota bacterium]|jgi:cephalosporin-C deacetylase-like acetyl esterase